MRTNSTGFALCTMLATFAATEAGGQERWSGAESPVANTAAAKGRYTLFDPTPDHLLRDMTTDRPDITESPFTIDAGRIQIETQAFGYSQSRRDGDGVRTRAYEIGTTNVRVGLTSFAEINFVWQPVGIERQTGSGIPERRSGTGNVDIRGKVNLWGNDSFGEPGSTALALLPFVSVPTDRDNGISSSGTDAGLIVPFALQFTDKFGFGMNAGLVSVHDEHRDRHTQYLASAALSHEWTESLGSYYEVAAEFGANDGDIVLLGTGLTYALDEHTQLDAGINFGVTRASDRVNPFVGISRRF